jgi:hypothetical protein
MLQFINGVLNGWNRVRFSAFHEGIKNSKVIAARNSETQH